MPYLDRLSEILRNNLVQNGNTLIGQAGCNDVTIKGNLILFKSDSDIIHQNVLCSLFNDQVGYTKKNDWIVFGENKVLICEMKTYEEYEFKSQLKNGKLLVDFILQKMNINEVQNKPNSIKYKYVLFSNRSSKLTSNGRIRGTKCNELNGLLYELTCGKEYLLNDF